MAVDIYGLSNINIAGSANISASKVEAEYRQCITRTGTVTAFTEYVHYAKGNGSVMSVDAAITETIATGADRTVTIDLQKSTGGGAFSTILSATIVLDDDSTLRIAEAATLASSALVAGDILKVVCTVAGSADDQALGLIVQVTVRESHG